MNRQIGDVRNAHAPNTKRAQRLRLDSGELLERHARTAFFLYAAVQNGDRLLRGSDLTIQ